MGSETPLQRTVGELGVDVGELGVDSPSRSANMVEPATKEKKPTVTFKNWGDDTLGICGRGAALSACQELCLISIKSREEIKEKKPHMPF